MYEYRHGGNVHAEPGRENVLDFSASINPLGPPKQVEQAVREAFRYVDRYPDNRSTRLRESIAEFENVPPDWIFCGNGSSDILFRLPKCARAKTGLVLRPSFSDYERALIASEVDVRFHDLEEAAGFACDGPLPQTLASDAVDLLFLGNPNSPTGSMTDRPVIERILSSCTMKSTTVVIDECFMDLAARSKDYTAKPFLSSHENLVIVKAFTKTFALPGLRLGYAICSDPKRIDALYSHGPDWPVSNLAQAAGIAALQNAHEYLAETHIFLERERIFVQKKLRELGFFVFDAVASFLLVKNPHEFNVKEKLDEKSARVRSFTKKEGLGPDFFRLGLSTHENNVRLIESLQEILAGKGGRR